ncbi:hypothetical protein, partial [Burkholderia stabilis]
MMSVFVIAARRFVPLNSQYPLGLFQCSVFCKSNGTRCNKTCPSRAVVVQPQCRRQADVSHASKTCCPGTVTRSTRGRAA